MLDKIKEFENEWKDDIAFPELQNYKELENAPQALEDINKTESDKFHDASNRALLGLNTAGNLIKDVINAKLDTATKQILGDFVFGTSGAIKMITDENNGLWLSPAGILGKKAGVTTFAVDTSGNATFAGTLSAATGTLGAITIGTNAWHVDSSGNMWWGNYASYAAALDKISNSGLYSRIRIIRNDPTVGFYYKNEANVQNIGLDLAMGEGLGLTNSNPAIRVKMGGTGEVFWGDISHTGRGIFITRSIGSGTSPLLALQSTNLTAGIMIDILRSGSGVLTGIKIDQITGSNSVNTGITIGLSSGNAALCYAFRFDGSEIVAAAVGGSQNRKIRVSVGGTDYYIPLYTA